MCLRERRCACVLPLAGPGVRHTAHDGGEHQSGDEGEENQVDDSFHAVITQAGQRLNVVLHRGRRAEECEVFGKSLVLRSFLS